MEHPRLVRWLNRVFNPPRYEELRTLDTLRQDQHVKPDDYDRQKAALENPGDVSFTKIYAMLGLSVVAAVVVIAMVVSRG